RLKAQNYQFPASLEEWAGFDYIGRSNEWLTGEQKREIEHFKFYQRLAYSGNRSLLRRPLQLLSRWRVERKFYAFPIERSLIERLRPAQALS
ncbi:MAG: B12-binding domain-containing radical SAM protein, partial [Chloroflexi bacterium]|nr:B12-binding domain-containing radical SAM protein [Chloroflexota bacterium]